MKKSKTKAFEPTDRYFNIGYHYHIKGDLEKAAECYVRSLQNKPSARAHVFLANILSQFGEVDSAIEECKYALDLDPKYGHALNDLGAYLLQKRKYKEAEKYLNRACKTKSYENKEHAHFNLARFYLHKGMLLRASTELKLCTKINPEFTPAKAFLNLVQNQLH